MKGYICHFVGSNGLVRARWFDSCPDMGYPPDGVLMLGQRRRRLASIKPAIGRCIVFVLTLSAPSYLLLFSLAWRYKLLSQFPPRG